MEEKKPATESDKLKEFIDGRVKEIMAAELASPDSAFKKQLQTKYKGVFDEAMRENEKRGFGREDGTLKFAKFARVVLSSGNDKEKALKIASDRYPDDKEIQGYFKALTVGTPSEGGFAVPEALSSDIIQFLYPKLAYSRLGARRIDMPNGNLNLPRFDARASSCTSARRKPPERRSPRSGT